jgi:tRNA (mo5U34)-methyltransferase
VDRDDLLARVAAIQWCHSIDLGDGIVTPGLSKTVPPAASQLPPIAGKSVLDIGTWDGLNAFAAERLGASRVVALDHYAWGVDMVRRNAYWEACRQEGRMPDWRLDETEFWDESLPGKAGFDLAREALCSKVEGVVGDFMRLDPATLGTFDVVLFLGVLYHLREPLAALERVRALTDEVAVIETSAVVVPGHEGEPLLRCYPANELDGDFGNYFGVSAAGLRALVRMAGFSRLEVTVGPPRLGRRERRPRVYRLLAHAWV